MDLLKAIEIATKPDGFTYEGLRDALSVLMQHQSALEKTIGFSDVTQGVRFSDVTQGVLRLINNIGHEQHLRTSKVVDRVVDRRAAAPPAELSPFAQLFEKWYPHEASLVRQHLKMAKVVEAAKRFLHEFSTMEPQDDLEGNSPVSRAAVALEELITEWEAK